MALIRKFERVLLFLAIFTLVTIPTLINAQSGNYSGNESNIYTEDLIEVADKTEFGDNISSYLMQDIKNKYYAVKVSKLTTQFEKIRLLELSYEDNEIVSMGADDNNIYYFFLVNNILNKTEKEINDKLTGFSITSKKEYQELNSEQLRLWLIQHDKYSNKTSTK